MPKERQLKVAYLHGRPAPHPMHERLAKAVVNDKILYIDEKLRWQDRRLPFPVLIFAWILNSFFYPRNCDVYLVDGLHFSPVIFKKLFLKRNQKVIAHLGSHTLYFLYTGKFGKINTFLNKWLLRNYDGFFCEGSMAKTLVEKLLDHRGLPELRTTFLGPPSERYGKLSQLHPALNTQKILFISNGPGLFRKYYKGLDLLVKAFGYVKQEHTQSELHIVGTWDDLVVKELKSFYPQGEGLYFHGGQKDISHYLSSGSIYVQVTRGDAFPTATLEAMSAGLPVLVSEWTGTKEVVCQADPSFIVPLDPSVIAAKIIDYFNLPLIERERISERFREVVKSYTEEKAIEHYRNEFNLLMKKLEGQDTDRLG